MIIKVIYFLGYSFFVGVLAKTLSFQEDDGGFVPTILIGFGGSFFSGALMGVLGFHYQKGISVYGLMPAVICAIGLLFLGSFVKGKLTH